MKLGRVTGTVTATAKDARLTGQTMLVCDIVDGKGKVLEPAQIAVDTVGAGSGDLVLIVTGSAARMSVRTTGAPVDAAITAIVDRVDFG